MPNQLDSRALDQADCYAQRFMKAGTYRYTVVAGHGQAIASDYPFAVVVEDGGAAAEMAQHDIRVRARDRGFDVDRASLTVRIGDMVLWNGGGVPMSFAVVGEQAFFSSYRMVNECGFSHAFGTAGEVHWADAYGSGCAGVVRVRDPECKTHEHLARWQRSLAEGKVVMISDAKADRTEVEITTGQTVFFAIVKGPGISITDKQLLDVVRYPDY